MFLSKVEYATPEICFHVPCGTCTKRENGKGDPQRLMSAYSPVYSRVDVVLIIVIYYKTRTESQNETKGENRNGQNKEEREGPKAMVV